MITIKNAALVASVGVLSTLNNSKCPIKLAFKLKTIVDKVNPCIKIIDELRKKIIDTHSNKDPDGKPIFIDKQKQYISISDEGSKEMNELLELSTDLDIQHITTAELEQVQADLTPQEIGQLAWLLKD